jgi:hypothetical protein
MRGLDVLVGLGTAVGKPPCPGVAVGRGVADDGTVGPTVADAAAGPAAFVEGVPGAFATTWRIPNRARIRPAPTRSDPTATADQ